ncbi:MAG: 5-formyltetrahydrofolate cyclo-ligase [Oscillospiraceae bacterium]|jgi:5-formyltetrahydrofolate cyclo-ligase|nr:5-formyltetrahydrofolate cyclo-ligase [Oscillospiraceae bacterium]
MAVVGQNPKGGRIGRRSAPYGRRGKRPRPSAGGRPEKADKPFAAPPPNDIRLVKKGLREGFKAARRAMVPDEQQKKDRRILERVCQLPEYRQAALVLTYVSTAIEVDTRALIERALAEGKQVAVPRCTPGKIDMKFYLIRGLSELSPGAFGVLEPNPEKSRELKNFKQSLCILPGLGFDLAGYRLGYGKGYYDRFLARYSGKRVGVCYNSCVRALLPHGRYDKSADVLVTEKFVKRFQAG